SRSPPVRTWSSSGDGIRRTASTTASRPAPRRLGGDSGTEIGEHAVAHIFPDKAVEPRISVEYRPGWLTLLSKSAEATLLPQSLCHDAHLGLDRSGGVQADVFPVTRPNKLDAHRVTGHETDRDDSSWEAKDVDPAARLGT